MTKNRIRMFSINLTGEREFYVAQAYRDAGDGYAEMTGIKHNITQDVRPFLVKAQRDMAEIIKEQLLIMRETLEGGPNFDEVMEVIDDEIANRQDDAEGEVTHG